MLQCAKIQNHTHTCDTCFGKHHGLPIPVLNPVRVIPNQVIGLRSPVTPEYKREVKLAQKGAVLVNTNCIYTVLEGLCTQTMRTNECNTNKWNPRGKPNQHEMLAKPQNSITSPRAPSAQPKMLPSIPSIQDRLPASLATSLCRRRRISNALGLLPKPLAPNPVSTTPNICPELA